MKRSAPGCTNELGDGGPGADEDHAAQERNAGIAIAVLALVVVGLLLAIVTGGTDAFQPLGRAPSAGPLTGPGHRSLRAEQQLADLQVEPVRVGAGAVIRRSAWSWPADSMTISP